MSLPLRIEIIDFGSQYTLLIAKVLRKLNVYTEVHLPTEAWLNHNSLSKCRGLILSGGPHTVRQADLIWYQKLIETKLIKGISIPILGICYGAQLIASYQGAKIDDQSSYQEYGQTEVIFSNPSNDPLYQGLSKDDSIVWMSHSDSIHCEKNPQVEIQGRTKIGGKVAAFRIKDQARSIYGLQFHPEVTHTTIGSQILKNFLSITQIEANWTPENYLESTIQQLRTQIGSDKVLVACSGGVDSTVVASLLQRAIGDQMVGVFVDTGLLRANEFSEVLEGYRQLGLNVTGLNRSAEFYQRLEGLEEPEQKRKVIGHLFIEIFQQFATEHGVNWLGQGTIYPDVIESMGQIKSHHNVGGLPEKLNLKLVEPLRQLFKDEVRELGQILKLPQVFIGRHPFPGPGLGIRILGPFSSEKVAWLQLADQIFIDHLKHEGLYDQVWQAGAIWLDSKSVGVMGDGRTYQEVVCLRAVDSVNGMTAKVSNCLSMEFLTRVATEIVNRVPGVNRVVYDITSKPPGTIEWQ